MNTNFIFVLIQTSVCLAHLLSDKSTRFNCDVAIISQMHFHDNNHCVQIVGGRRSGDYLSHCISTIIQNASNTTIYMRSLSWLIVRNVYTEDSITDTLKNSSTKYCEHFLIFLQNFTSISNVMRSTEIGVRKQFYPFSKLYFFLEDSSRIVNSLIDKNVYRHFYEEALFGYTFEFNFKLKMIIGLRNFVSGNNIHNSYLDHPFVSRQNSNKEFRISLHNCFPYIIYVDEENLIFEGVEYHFVKEITKNWRITYNLRDLVKTKKSPWITMLQDLDSNTSDLVMCAAWLTDYDNQYDLSTFHGHECHTLLTPKPKRLSEVTAIYTTLSSQVWMWFGFCFIATTLLLWGIAHIKIDKGNVYVNLSRTCMEVTNIATAHGVGRLPTQNSVKILLLSWIYLSLWIGICYTTIYSSRLTCQGYTKIVNTLQDFLDSDLLWGTYYVHEDLQKSFSKSDIVAYHEFRKRMVVFKSQSEAIDRIKTGKYGVFAGTAAEKYFMSYVWMNQLELLSSFRLMKQCTLKYYSVFLLQKYSPYTELFSDYALKFQEHGFSQYWYGSVFRDKQWFEKFFEDYPSKNIHPERLKFVSISGALLILFMGWIISVIVFLCEIMLK